MTELRTREALRNLLGSQVRLSPTCHGLGLAFGTHLAPWLEGRLQKVDHSFAELEMADGSRQKVFISDIFEAVKAPR